MTSISDPGTGTRPATATISVRVLVFGLYAELAGRESMTCEVIAPATVADVLAVARRVPGLERMPARVLVAVNQVHARDNTPVKAGDEVAILPPLAGG